jgi:hypothetical protein
MSNDEIFSLLVRVQAFFASITLEGIEKTVKYCLAIAFAYVAVTALRRLPMIKSTFTSFQDARSPIWDLRKTIDDFRTSIDELKRIAPLVAGLKDQIGLLTEKMDAAQKQVAELQIRSASEREGDGPDTAPSGNSSPRGEMVGDSSASTSPTAPRAINGSIRGTNTNSSNGAGNSSNGEEQNWEILRELWYANTGRLESVISNIADGRRKLKYDRTPRYRYEPVIAMLEADGLITPGVATASRKLNSIFMAHKSRKRPVAAEVLGPIVLLDKQLSAELNDRVSTANND